MILKENPDNQKIFKDMGMNKWRETKMADLKRGIRVRLYSFSGRPAGIGRGGNLSYRVRCISNRGGLGGQSQESLIGVREKLIDVQASPEGALHCAWASRRTV